VVVAVISYCAEKSPLTVMARLTLQKALEPAWIDELFEREGGTQYQWELLFSTTVELMSVVAVGLRPSVHAVAQACPELPVSIQALYDKIKRTESNLMQALVAARGPGADSGRKGANGIRLPVADRGQQSSPGQ
jgi:hypothetical protein